MRRSGTVFSFVTFAVITQAIILFLANQALSPLATAYGFVWAVVLFIIYKLAMEYKEESWVSKELRAYAIRSQSSNRMAFAIVTAIGLLPVNALIIPVEISRLAFYQMAAVLMTEGLFEILRTMRNAYKASSCKETVKEKEVRPNGTERHKLDSLAGRVYS